RKPRTLEGTTTRTGPRSPVVVRCGLPGEKPMRKRHGLVAAALALGLVLIPVGVAPAQAAETVRTLAVCSGSALCASENLPILTTYAAMYGTGGATAATGATAAATATGLGGTLGFGTVVGASGAAIGVGIMKLTGVDEGLFIETDPDFFG